jgi:hypothetical protein
MRSRLVLLPCRLVSFSRNSLRFLVFHFERTLIPSSPPELASPPLLRSRLGSPRTLQIAPIPSSSGSRPSTSAVPHLFRPLRLSGSTFRHFLRDSFSAPLQLLSRLLLPLHPSPERPARRPVRAILCLSPFMSCCLPPSLLIASEFWFSTKSIRLPKGGKTGLQIDIQALPPTGRCANSWGWSRKHKYVLPLYSPGLKLCSK